MTKRIFRAVLFVAVAVLTSSLLIIMGCMYEYFGRIQKKQLRDELNIAASAADNYGIEYIKKLRSDNYRFTIIAKDGTVLYDTKYDASGMENHSDREEVQEALEQGSGESVRQSSTVFKRTIYSAVLLEDGTVLRISVDFGSIWTLAFGTFQPFVAVLIIAAIISYFIAKKVSETIVAPLNSLDLEHPLENDAYDEISPLLNRVNHQQKEISAQLSELNREKGEFTQITESMNEGLVLLDDSKNVVSINPSAQKLFGTTKDCIGQSFLTVNRSRDVSYAIDSAFEKGHSDLIIDCGGRKFQINVSRVSSERSVYGAVLLAFDVSEQEFAERNRREFTANVSHELKSPLQSIIGSAELLENDLVKPEDMQRFIGHIHSEATRLVNLIEDIIRLAELDEGTPLATENIDLLETAKEVSSVLAETAGASGVTVSVSGESTVIPGSQRMIYEIIYNLCDNAIKYNVPDGKVDISVSERRSEAVLSVKDTGIGIPEESRSRVFERFYRVDKSHSRASGGTGLGLSIVKHAVQYHHGKIELDSEMGKGTEIKISFPLG